MTMTMWPFGSHAHKVSPRIRRPHASTTGSERDLDAEHRVIAGAALARDSARAKPFMADHRRLTTDILQASKIPFADD